MDSVSHLFVTSVLKVLEHWPLGEWAPFDVKRKMLSPTRDCGRSWGEQKQKLNLDILMPSGLIDQLAFSAEFNLLTKLQKLKGAFFS